jgi:hypothetical protein
MYKELINSIPSSWDTLTLRQFQKIIDIVPVEEDSLFVGVNNSMKVIAALTGRSEEQISSMDIPTVTAMAERLNFMLTEPDKRGKTVLKWKQVDKITYNEYVTFLTVSKDPLHNLHTLIQAFSTNDLTDEQVLNLSMQEVHVGFFILVRHVRKYVKHLILIKSLRMLLIQLPKQILIHIWGKFRNKKGN